MSMHWERVPFANVVFLQEGPGIRSYEYQKDGYPIINVRCVQNGYIDLSTCNAANVELATGKWKHFQVQEGDILFTISGSIGRTAIVKKTDLPLLMNTSVVRFRSISTKLRDDFLYYYLQSWGFLSRLHALSSGTAQKNVGPTHLKTLDVPIPPLPEQQRIVTLLDEAFDGIATAKANAEKSLQNARAIFESHLQSVFTRSGEGWTKTTLGKATGGVFTGPFGSLLHKSDYVQNGIPLVNPAHITDVGIEPDFCKTVSEATARKLSSYIMRKGDVVIGRRGEMGRCALVTDIEDGWLCGTGSFYIKPSPRCDSGYLARYLRSDACKRRLEEIAGGAVMPNLSNTDLSNLSFDLPSLEIQISISDQVDDVADETQRLGSIYHRKVAALDELKKSLLHRAFSGDL